MSWSEVAVVFFASHAVGDYLLQTDWQATHKPGGLGHDGVARRALFAHVATYLVAYIPALVWLATGIGLWTPVVAGMIAIPHLVQDDRRLLYAYMRHVKHAEPSQSANVALLVDQGFHVIALFVTALFVSAIS